MPQDTLNAIVSLTGIPLWLIVVVLIWSLIWKGIALWKAGRKSHLIWFVVLLVVNTLGILEILYIYVFSELKFEEKKQKGKKQAKTNKRFPKLK